MSQRIFKTGTAAAKDMGRNYEEELLNEIKNWYETADLKNPDYDDTWVYKDQDEDWYDRYAHKIGEDKVYKIHDDYLASHGVDLKKNLRYMPAHKIRAMFTK